MDQDPTEIFTNIGSYLTLKDYLHCIQVARSWYSVFIPFLWQTIDDSLHAWPRILKTLDSDDTAKPFGQDEEWLFGIFANCSNDNDNDKDIRVACSNFKSFSVADIALTGPLLSPLFENTFKSQLRGTRTEDQQLKDWRFVQQFWLLVQQNHAHLQVLRIDTSLDSLVEMNTTGFMDSVVVDHLTNLFDLQYMELRCDTATLLRRLPRLRSLQSQVVFMDGVLTGSYASLWCLSAWRSLRLLRIVTLLQRLPNLNGLALTD
ncbi:hypothetical protein BGZ47_010730 [Haplosporangium gracile]|nr:hypothetical protein BGZ47_010730 [Haplosporangium gracile]